MNKYDIIEVLHENGYTDEQIKNLTPYDILELVCNYEGLINYASWILRTIENIDTIKGDN